MYSTSAVRVNLPQKNGARYFAVNAASDLFNRSIKDIASCIATNIHLNISFGFLKPTTEISSAEQYNITVTESCARNFELQFTTQNS